MQITSSWLGKSLLLSFIALSSSMQSFATELDSTPVTERKVSPVKKASRKVKNSDPKQVYGWKEKICFEVANLTLKAKLDTGARTSSIHAQSEVIFERDGKKWVRFVTISKSNTNNKPHTLEAPLVRTTLIKEPNGSSVQRNVVRLTYSIGDRKIRSQFTLNNRANMICPILLGRKAIAQLGFIDVNQIYLAEKKIMR